ncbi:hypothetical protein [Legionella brunensis]|uniref:Uncharacterized protein n=1 Tax=Legionella brunensis TaxID=29422 RepID=A0A0W0SDB8_9GAMM|nr:hypothetical protein [Legionella brunensis]KTC81503.1 hypothetical protein Lbru_2023 [Legionella brunensis]
MDTEPKDTKTRKIVNKWIKNVQEQEKLVTRACFEEGRSAQGFFDRSLSNDKAKKTQNVTSDLSGPNI